MKERSQNKKEARGHMEKVETALDATDLQEVAPEKLLDFKLVHRITTQRVCRHRASF